MYQVKEKEKKKSYFDENKNEQQEKAQQSSNPYDGTPLNISPELSGRIKESFGINPSQIKFRESQQVADSGAVASAQGDAVRFAPGYFKPDSYEGLQVIGHELAHVKEQAGGGVEANAENNIHYDATNEARSDSAGDAFASGEMGGAAPVSVNSGSAFGAPVQQKGIGEFFKSAASKVGNFGKGFLGMEGTKESEHTLVGTGKNAHIKDGDVTNVKLTKLMAFLKNKGLKKIAEYDGGTKRKSKSAKVGGWAKGILGHALGAFNVANSFIQAFGGEGLQTGFSIASLATSTAGMGLSAIDVKDGVNDLRDKEASGLQKVSAGLKTGAAMADMAGNAAGIVGTSIGLASDSDKAESVGNGFAIGADSLGFMAAAAGNTAAGGIDMGLDIAKAHNARTAKKAFYANYTQQSLDNFIDTLIEALVAEISRLEQEIKTITDEIATLDKEIANIEKEIFDMGPSAANATDKETMENDKAEKRVAKQEKMELREQKTGEKAEKETKLAEDKGIDTSDLKGKWTTFSNENLKQSQSNCIAMKQIIGTATPMASLKGFLDLDKEKQQATLSSSQGSPEYKNVLRAHRHQQTERREGKHGAIGSSMGVLSGLAGISASVSGIFGTTAGNEGGKQRAGVAQGASLAAASGLGLAGDIYGKIAGAHNRKEIIAQRFEDEDLNYASKPVRKYSELKKAVEEDLKKDTDAPKDKSGTTHVPYKYSNNEVGDAISICLVGAPGGERVIRHSISKENETAATPAPTGP